VKSLLRKANLQGLLKDSHWGSEAAMYQHFAENPHNFMVWGEFSEMLGRLNNYGDCKAWLTDRYDDTDPPNSVGIGRLVSPVTTHPISSIHLLHEPT
jgi:hypothetical protein